MSARSWDYGYVFLTIAFSVYGQLILKWRIVEFGELPPGFRDKTVFLFCLLFDPYIFSGLVAAFIASMTWMAALTKFELNYAYSLMSLTFVAVLLLSAWLLHESINVEKIIGVSLIVAGTIVASRG